MILYAIAITRFSPSIGKRVCYACHDGVGAWWAPYGARSMKTFTTAEEAEAWVNEDCINFLLYDFAICSYNWDYDLDSVAIVRINTFIDTVKQIPFNYGEEDEE